MNPPSTPQQLQALIETVVRSIVAFEPDLSMEFRHGTSTTVAIIQANPQDVRRLVGPKQQHYRAILLVAEAAATRMGRMIDLPHIGENKSSRATTPLPTFGCQDGWPFRHVEQVSQQVVAAVGGPDARMTMEAAGECGAMLEVQPARLHPFSIQTMQSLRLLFRIIGMANGASISTDFTA